MKILCVTLDLINLETIFFFSILKQDAFPQSQYIYFAMTHLLKSAWEPQFVQLNV